MWLLVTISLKQHIPSPNFLQCLVWQWCWRAFHSHEWSTWLAIVKSLETCRLISTRPGPRQQSQSSHPAGQCYLEAFTVAIQKHWLTFQEDGSIEIKECLWRGHLLHGRYALDVARGPFTSKADFYDSLVSAFTEHAEILQLLHHCFVAPIPSPEDYPSSVQYRSASSLWNNFVTIRQKINSSDNRLGYIIAGDALRDIIQRFELPCVNPETFPLCHADLSVNNIYIDDKYNITYIIDWAFTSSIPESMLLAAAGLPKYRDELSPQLRLSFIDGFIDSMPESIKESSVHRYRE